jgi:tRNA threonylcarbamoyladenosine biosynthesis protein TsaB
MELVLGAVHRLVFFPAPTSSPILSPMRFIVVDTADGRGSIAIFDEREVLAIEEHASEEDYSIWLLPAVRRVLARSSLSLAELDGYAVCAGPGSFTGLRVGLTTVKAWAEIYGKPIASLSRLEAFSVSSPEPESALVASYSDARRDQVFAALYARSGSGYESLGAESVISLPDFVAAVREKSAGKPVRWVTPDPALLGSGASWPALLAAGHILQSTPPPFAPLLGVLACRKFRQGRTTDALSLDANYVRRSDAEMLWKGNKSAFKA